METKIKAAGYVRVSSKEQVDGESLTTQRKSIESFCKQNNYELVEIYADEGISGGSVKDRHALLRCLNDGHEGKFKILIVHRLSRFGRNANELLNNHKELKYEGIELRSISEGIDFSPMYGEFMLTMLAAVAQLDRDIIREQMLENRISRGKRGIPTVGSLPYARTYNKETGEWKLDADKAKVIQQVAEDFLKGESLSEIATRLSMSYGSLRKRLVKYCGDEWVVKFKDQEPFTYKIPRILTDDLIQQVKDRLSFNRTSNRTDIFEKYLLTGFIHCDVCSAMISGHTFRGTKVYRYYKHRQSICKAFSRINAPAIENAVFQTIFENVVDVPNFEKAIANSLPDAEMVEGLMDKIKKEEKELIKIQKEIDKLVDSVIKGTLSEETIKKKEQELLKAKSIVNNSLESHRFHLKSLPDIGEVKKEAAVIRRKLEEHLGSKEHLMSMSFDEKRALLHWLFDGKDDKGNIYGIYVNTKGKGRGIKQVVDYYLYGKIVGLRTLKGDDIDYMGFVDEEIMEDEKRDNKYNTFLLA
jgi:DNA invertase Pin-like site-specific DNA recombinase/Skp family chaperone for outer membrane proteins